jgi:hypothetical protein
MQGVLQYCNTSILLARAMSSSLDVVHRRAHVTLAVAAVAGFNPIGSAFLLASSCLVRRRAPCCADGAQLRLAAVLAYGGAIVYGAGALVAVVVAAIGRSDTDWKERNTPYLKYGLGEVLSCAQALAAAWSAFYGRLCRNAARAGKRFDLSIDGTVRTGTCSA